MIQKRENKWYGWKPGLPDQRNYKFAREIYVPSSLPTKVDLTESLPRAYDQLALGGCVSNAIAGLSQFLMKKLGKPNYTPSRLWMYWNQRFIEGTVDEDSGATIADGMKVAHKLGLAHESLWWYNISKFKIKPNKGVYADGLKCKIGDYYNLNNSNINELKSCLALGFPFVFGFSVYESFESDSVARTGLVPLPGKGEALLGGHAVLAVGYDDAERVFIVRNSWGTDWGLNGYFKISYDYLTNTDLADDFWTAHTLV